MMAANVLPLMMLGAPNRLAVYRFRTPPNGLHYFISSLFRPMHRGPVRSSRAVLGAPNELLFPLEKRCLGNNPKALMP